MRDPGVRMKRAVLTDRARSVFGTALADTNISARALAERLGLSPTVVERWLSGHTHVPLWILASEELPLAVRARIAAALLSSEGPGPHGARDTRLETLLLLRSSAEASAQLADSLIDSSVPERTIRGAVAALRDRCEKWLAAHSQYRRAA